MNKHINQFNKLLQDLEHHKPPNAPENEMEEVTAGKSKGEATKRDHTSQIFLVVIHSLQE
jgi:hypothetical protein